MNMVMQDEILEGNKLIAEFMGEYGQGLVSVAFIEPPLTTETKKIFLWDEVKYHSSWDWLMPAWYKCYESLMKLNSTSSWHFIDRMKSALVTANKSLAWKVLTQAVKFINE